MNKQDIQSSVYAQKVDLLLRLLPLVMEEKVFAVHGGTAINLFLRNLPRYSVDIDLTYIPLADRKKSIGDINFHLKSISEKARKAFPGMHIGKAARVCPPRASDDDPGEQKHIDPLRQNKNDP